MNMTRSEFLSTSMAAMTGLALGSARSEAPTQAPARQLDRAPLETRVRFDFSDYGFELDGSLRDRFEIVPSTIDGAEAFLFFFPRDESDQEGLSLLNLHAFLKLNVSLEEFARGRGASVRRVPLEQTEVVGRPALTYTRRIRMDALFEGAPQVIDFIGGAPDLEVRDTHTYFQHRHNHYYTGLLHASEDHARFDRYRQELLAGVRLV